MYVVYAYFLMHYIHLHSVIINNFKEFARHSPFFSVFYNQDQGRKKTQTTEEKIK